MRDEYKFMLIAWAVVGLWIAFVIFANRKVHPKALFMLFMVELWERFSYYGMRALLVLYLTAKTMTGGFGLEDKAAYGIYAAYGALVYLTPLIGGLLADKYLGFRRSIIVGASLMALGQFTLALSSGDQILSHNALTSQPKEEQKKIVESTTVTSSGNPVFLYAGLALLVIGNGFFKPNISSLIGKFYTAGDPRRDGAFTIFYMGINIGAFLTPITCGAIGEIEGWKYGFLTAGIGMVGGLCIFLYTVSTGVLEKHADAPEEKKQIAGMPAIYPILLGSLVMIPVAGMLIFKNDIMDYLLLVLGTGAIAYMLYLSFKFPVVERQRMWVIIVLLIFTAIFWTFFELAGSALNIFTERNVSKTLLSIDFPTSTFQSINAFFIMIFAPIFSYMWIKLGQSGREPAAPIKFAIGLLLLGGGFMVLNLGKAASVAGIVPALYLILLYLLHTLGELALSPVGLSLVTKLAPAKIVGFMMGFWFLSSAIAHQAGKWISGETVPPKDATPEQTLDLALGVFNSVGYFALGSGVLLLILSPILKKWMHGIK